MEKGREDRKIKGRRDNYKGAKSGVKKKDLCLSD